MKKFLKNHWRKTTNGHFTRFCTLMSDYVRRMLSFRTNSPGPERKEPFRKSLQTGCPFHSDTRNPCIRHLNSVSENQRQIVRLLNDLNEKNDDCKQRESMLRDIYLLLKKRKKAWKEERDGHRELYRIVGETAGKTAETDLRYKAAGERPDENTMQCDCREKQRAYIERQMKKRFCPLWLNVPLFILGVCVMIVLTNIAHIASEVDLSWSNIPRVFHLDFLKYTPTLFITLITALITRKRLGTGLLFYLRYGRIKRKYYRMIIRELD